MDLSKEELLKLAREWITKETFRVNSNGSKIEVTPISSCGMKFPVNVIANGVLNGFINYITKDNSLNDLLKDIQLPPNA